MTLFESFWRIRRCWEVPISFKISCHHGEELHATEQLDISAVATKVVKTFEFRFVIHMKLKECMGVTRGNIIIIIIHILGLERKNEKGNTLEISVSF